ncbi:MAG TPA: hypothetical protein VNA15_02395, partial [Candidatus Angelobacter sp.]|nr:hypothetical protein [Candidatus Angelobacter sp.]
SDDAYSILLRREESRLEDQGSRLFCALKRKTRLEYFQLADALWKKGAGFFFLATRKCSLRRSYLKSGQNQAQTV